METIALEKVPGHRPVSTHLLWEASCATSTELTPPGKALAVRPNAEEEEAAPQRALETKDSSAQRREGPEIAWE